MELLLLTVANENETKTHKYQFQFTDAVDITMNDASSLGKFSIPGSDFSLDSFFSIQKVVITQPSHLIIKNISKVDYDFETLKGKLKKFGQITELRIVDDCTKRDNYICFVNFANKEDAFKCIQQVTAEKHWFANYHIERLERDKLLYLDTKHESSEKEFTKVYVSLQNNVDQKKLQKQIKTQNTIVILPPFESSSDEFKINQFDGFKLYSSVSKLLEEKNLHNDVASFTYNHGYFLIKFAKHEQALDCINHLDNVELNFLDETICLKPHRANVRKSVGKGKRDSLALDTEKIASYQSNSMTEIFKNRQSLKNKNSFSIQSLESRSSSISSTSGSPKFKSFNEVGSSSSLMDLPSPSMKDASPLTTFGANFNEKMFTNNEFFPVPIPVPYPVLMTPMNTFAMPPPPFLNYSLQPPNSYNYSTKPLSPKTDVNKSMNWSYPIPTSVHQHSNLYFQNLPLSWTDKDLFDFVVSYLEQTGDFEEPEKEIISYKVITQNFHDKQHKGESKGYAFVSFSNPLVASKCAYDMHMYKLEESEYDNESERKQSVESVDLEDRFKLRVSFAKKRGRSLELANSKPITMNKQFMECLDSIM